MSRHSRGSFRGRGTTARRITAWAAGPATGGDPGSPELISQSGTTSATVSVTPTAEGITLVRTRGVLSFKQVTATAAGDGFNGAFGILLAGNEAVTAGAASLPDPQDESGDERWLYHTFFRITSNTTTAADIGADNGAGIVIDVDSKAMRKFPVDLRMVAMLGVVEEGTATMEWMFDSRALVKLP